MNGKVNCGIITRKSKEQAEVFPQYGSSYRSRERDELVVDAVRGSLVGCGRGSKRAGKGDATDGSTQSYSIM